MKIVEEIDVIAVAFEIALEIEIKIVDEIDEIAVAFEIALERTLVIDSQNE